MKRLLIVCAAMLCLAWAAISCTDPITVDIPNPNQGQETVKPAPATDSMTITVTLEQETSTKTSLDGNSVVWSSGDKIKVFNASNPDGVVFTFKDGSTNIFTGEVVSGEKPFYAVYPASAAGSLSGGSISLTVPAKQNYVADSFGPAVNFSGGETDDLSSGFTFKNFFGLLKLQVKGSATIESIAVYSKNSTDVLNGTFSLSFTGTGTSSVPVTTAVIGQTAESQKLTLDCGSSGVALETTAKPFYLVVPAGTLNDGMTVEVVEKKVNSGDPGAMVLNTGVYSSTDPEKQPYFINRSHVRPMQEFTYVFTCKSAFLKSETPSAAFSNVGADGTFTTCCEYTEGESQYSYLNTDSERTFRIQDWNDGYSLSVKLPKTLNAGTNVNIVVTALGATGAITDFSGEVTVLKNTADRVWLYDKTNKKGYVLMLVD